MMRRRRESGLKISNTAFMRFAWSPARRGLWKLNVVEEAQSRRHPPSPRSGGDAAASELFDAELNAEDKPFTAEDLAAAVQRADVLVPTVTDRVDGRVLSRAGEQLRLIAQFGAGVDNIDVATAVQRGITVTNTPGVLTEDTADMTMALILAVPRRHRSKA